MPSRISSAIESAVCAEFSTNLTVLEIAAKHNVSECTVKRVFKRNFMSGARHDRYRRMCAVGKMGDKNPMKGKLGPLHHAYVEEAFDSFGYKFVPAPTWYKGRVEGGKAAEHIIRCCEKYGLTKVERGFVVHHIDGAITNNNTDNLELLTIGEHMRHHNTGKPKHRKVQRLSRKGVGGSAPEAQDNSPS